MLFESWRVEEADALLSELEKRHPDNDRIKFHYAITQNSLGHKENALVLLEACLRLNPNHEDANCIMTPILLELADQYDGNDLIKLKEKFKVLAARGFENIGFDVASVYVYLADIARLEENNIEAADYLRLAKEIYLKDEFLKKHHVDSGDIDAKISAAQK